MTQEKIIGYKFEGKLLSGFLQAEEYVFSLPDKLVGLFEKYMHILSCETQEAADSFELNELIELYECFEDFSQFISSENLFEEKDIVSELKKLPSTIRTRIL